MSCWQFASCDDALAHGPCDFVTGCTQRSAWTLQWCRLNENDIAYVIEAARRSYERYREVKGHYANKLLTHIVGRAGEMASELTLTKICEPVLPHWRDPEKETLCDVEASGLRIEVKTWSNWFWYEYGRCVAVDQLEDVARKADAVLWVTVNSDFRDEARWQRATEVSLQLRGYSTLDDVRAADVRETGSQKVKNHQVDVIRPLSDLFEFLRK